MPDLRTLDFRCAFIIEACDQPARFHKDVDLQTMLGNAQKVPNKTQRDRALRYRQGQEWPQSCRNTQGRGGIEPHQVLAPAWSGPLSEEHFYEPWHLYCKTCNDADADAQGDARWEADGGANPPPRWGIGDPYPTAQALTRSRRDVRRSPSAAVQPVVQPSDDLLAALTRAYACSLVRQVLAQAGDDVEPSRDGEPFDLRAFGRDGERLVFVRVHEPGEPSQAEAAVLRGHPGQCWQAVVRDIKFKALPSGPQPLGGRVASLARWDGASEAQGS